MLNQTVPQSLRDGQPMATNWDAALRRLDPDHVFGSPLLDRMAG